MMRADELFAIVDKVKRKRWPKDVEWSLLLSKFCRICGRNGYIWY